MRKLLWVVAVGALVLTVAAPAMALDFKFGAEYRVRMYDYANTGFDSDNTLGRSNPRGTQIRIRPRFDVSDDNGNITATMRFEWGDTEFGGRGGANGSSFGQVPGVPGVINNVVIAPSNARVGNGSGGSIGADGVGLETKWAYIDFAMPFGIPLSALAGQDADGDGFTNYEEYLAGTDPRNPNSYPAGGLGNLWLFLIALVVAIVVIVLSIVLGRRARRRKGEKEPAEGQPGAKDETKIEK